MYAKWSVSDLQRVIAIVNGTLFFFKNDLMDTELLYQVLFRNCKLKSKLMISDIILTELRTIFMVRYCLHVGYVTSGLIMLYFPWCDSFYFQNRVSLFNIWHKLINWFLDQNCFGILTPRKRHKWLNMCIKVVKHIILSWLRSFPLFIRWLFIFYVLQYVAKFGPAAELKSRLPNWLFPLHWFYECFYHLNNWLSRQCLLLQWRFQMGALLSSSITNAT